MFWFGFNVFFKKKKKTKPRPRITDSTSTKFWKLRIHRGRTQTGGRLLGAGRGSTGRDCRGRWAFSVQWGKDAKTDCTAL